MGFWKTMEESIFASDWYIGVAAILTIVALAVSLKFMSSIKKEIQKNKRVNRHFSINSFSYI